MLLGNNIIDVVHIECALINFISNTAFYFLI